MGALSLSRVQIRCVEGRLRLAEQRGHRRTPHGRQGVGLGGPARVGPSAGPGFSVQLSSVSSTSCVPGHMLQTLGHPQPCHCITSANPWAHADLTHMPLRHNVLGELHSGGHVGRSEVPARTPILQGGPPEPSITSSWLKESKCTAIRSAY